MRHYLDSFTDVRKTGILFSLVVLVTLLCFIPTLFNDLLLTLDDGYGIVDNIRIRQISIETFRWAFTTYYFEDWLPLIWISLALEYALWGLNPVGYHLTNNVLHSLNAGLFFLILLALLKRHISLNSNTSALSGNRVYYCALFAALIYAIHPLRVESVAWAFEIKDVLSLFFGLIALFAYIATMKRRPKMEELYFERSHIHRQLGDTDRATADYNHALSLMPGQK